MRYQPLFVILAALLAVAIAWQLANHVFHRAYLTTDEHSYLFQAQVLLDGRLVREAPPFPEAFLHKQIVIDQGTGWFSRYPPGHPLWLMLGLLLGDPYRIVALGAGLALLIMAGAARTLGLSPMVAALLLLLSPFFLFMHGTLLSHTSGLLAVGLMVWMYAHWRISGSYPAALGAGLAWGWLFMNRTFPAGLIAVPFGIDALVHLARNRRRQCLFGVALFAGAALASVLVVMLYNQLVVGDYRVMTYLYYDPSERLGFGRRHLGLGPAVPGLPVRHTPLRGWGFVANNLMLLNRWLWGVPVSLVLWAILVAVGFTLPWTPLFAGAAILVWTGQYYFWYPGPHEVGPGYYYETLPMIIVTAMFGLQRLWTMARNRPRIRWAAAAVATIVVAVAGVRFSMRQAEWLSDYLRDYGRVLSVLNSPPPNSLIFVEGSDDYMAFNLRGLDGDAVRIRDMGPANASVIRRFPDRIPYRFVDGQPPRFEPLALEDIKYELNLVAARMARRTGTNESRPEGWVRIAREGDRSEWMFFGDYYYAHPGNFVAEFEVSAESDPPGAVVVRLDVAAGRGRQILVEKDLTAPLEGTVVVPFETSGYDLIEARAWYYGTGTVAIGRIHVRCESSDTERQDP